MPVITLNVRIRHDPVLFYQKLRMDATTAKEKFRAIRRMVRRSFHTAQPTLMVGVKATQLPYASWHASFSGIFIVFNHTTSAV